MPKKGKKKKKGGKKKGAAPKVDEGPPKPLVKVHDFVKWVTLDMRLVNWSSVARAALADAWHLYSRDRRSYLNFELKLRDDTPLFSLKKRLVERHGRMTELRLYKDHVSPETELSDEMLTLREVGVAGAGVDDEGNPEPPARATLVYDFKPHDSADPLLLVAGSREGPKSDLDAEEDAAARAAESALGGAGAEG